MARVFYKLTLTKSIALYKTLDFWNYYMDDKSITH